MRKNLKKNTAAKVTATILAVMVTFSSISVSVYANETTEAKEAVAEASEACAALESITEGTEAASKEDGGAIAQESVETFVETVENINTSETVNEAAAEIANVENDLATAAEADTKAETAASETAANAASAVEIAKSAVETVADTKAKAEDLAKVITDTDSTKEKAEEALTELDNITDNAAAELKIKKEVLGVISDRFEAAKKELEAAQKAYEDTVAGLKNENGSANAAAKKLEEAKKDVDNLAAAYENAKEDLKKEEALVNDIKAKKEISDKANEWKTQNALMKSITTGYIIPNLIDKDAKDITYSTETQRGFDRQNSSYCVVSYTDKDNNRVTRYFNIDRTDRQFKEDDQWYRLGSSREIIIYEKPEEDITSSKYQLSHYGDIAKKTNISKEFKTDVSTGKYDVFAFDHADGTKEFKCIDEIQEGIKTGEITEVNGTYIMNGIAGRKIVQTTSGNATGIRVSTKDDEGLKAYIENAEKLTNKYEQYSEIITDAKEKIDEAAQKVEAIQEVIDNIDDKNTRFTNIIDGLKGYLGEDDMAKIKAAGSDEKALKVLEEILAGAKKEFENASTELDELIVKREEIRKQLVEKNNVAAVEAEADETSTFSTTDRSFASGRNVELDAEADENTEVSAQVQAGEGTSVANVAGGTGIAVINGIASADFNEEDMEAVISDNAAYANTVVSNTVPAEKAVAGAGTEEIWWVALAIAVLKVIRMIRPLFV